MAGHLPVTDDEKLLTGRLGQNMTVEEGQHAAKLCALQLISAIKLACGDLDKVKKVVKVFGVVNSTSEFTDQATVINGCSDFLVDVFGFEIGRHARYACNDCNDCITFRLLS